MTHANRPESPDWDALLAVATAARERAYAPYSQFQVGAALLAESGEIFAGCNVENRSFGLCICAERTAVASAVAAGERSWRAVAVVTDTSPPALPCGMCRETLQELGGSDMEVLVANLAGESRAYRLGELHPAPFEWPPELPAGD
ncbi:MAG: cytidine deaminase [Acidobacteriota bacterium]